MQLPKELIPHREKLLSTSREFVKLQFEEKQPAAEAKEYHRSQLGGLPYWPKDMDYPVDPDEAPLLFMAQINFEEMPTIEAFPTRGMVQFFISENDSYGFDPNDPSCQEYFRIIYHAELTSDINCLKTDFPHLDFVENAPFPLHQEHQIYFEKQIELVPLTDVAFDRVFGPEFLMQFGDEEWNIREQYSNQIKAEGHKIGGYAFFTQEDPRDLDEDTLLLFQIDSEVDKEICWGDMGVANFFIPKEDLLNHNFSNVRFNWDCY